MPKQPKPTQPQTLESIDPAALANVSGGASRTPSASASSGGGSGDDAVLTALTGILDSIKSLQSQRSSGFNATEMMMFMMMLQQQSSPVVAAAPSLPVIYSDGGRIF